MSDSPKNSEDEILRMVHIVNSETIFQEPIQGILENYGFEFCKWHEEEQLFKDTQTKIDVFITVTKSYIYVVSETPVSMTSSIEHLITNQNRVLNYLNIKSPIGRFGIGCNDSGTVVITCAYKFQLLPHPEGFDAGWLAMSIRKLCSSVAWVVSNWPAIYTEAQN